MAVLYRNDTFSILVLSTNKQYSRFFKKVVVFQKICPKVKVLKTFKSSSDYHIKTWRRTKKGGLFSKSLEPFFSRTYALSVGFKKKPKKSFSSVKTKGNPNFAVKLAEKSKHPFLLSIWWIAFLIMYYLIHDNGS